MPLKGTESGEFEPVEVIVRFPAKLPPFCGAKVALKVVLCPAARLSGRTIPLMPNPAPLGVICEIVRAEPPEFVKV